MSKFLWVGNWPAIDFINTSIVIEAAPVDLLKSAQDVLLWLVQSGVCRKQDLKSSTIPKTLLEEARAYRSLLRPGLEGHVRRRSLPDELLERTNDLLAQGASDHHLTRQDKRYQIETHWRFQASEDYLAPIAESFARLVTAADPGRIRKCKNPACVLYFYDTSKGGKRSWCSLDICGNKLRMAASRERREDLRTE